MLPVLCHYQSRFGRDCERDGHLLLESISGISIFRKHYPRPIAKIYADRESCDEKAAPIWRSKNYLSVYVGFLWSHNKSDVFCCTSHGNAKGCSFLCHSQVQPRMHREILAPLNEVRSTIQLPRGVANWIPHILRVATQRAIPSYY